MDTFPTVTFDLTEFGFSGPEHVAPGLTHVVAHAIGTADHQLTLGRLNAGVSWATVEPLLKGSIPEAFTAVSTLVGGVGEISARHSANALVDLEPGTYVLACFIPAGDGTSHLAHGMFRRLDVDAATGTHATTTKSRGDIVLADMSITLPAGFDGTGRWRVVNKGTEAHELSILALRPGTTASQAVAAVTSSLKSPTTATARPFDATGGGAALSPGNAEWLDFDFAAGDYLFACFIPNQKHGNEAHFVEGMHVAFHK